MLILLMTFPLVCGGCGNSQVPDELRNLYPATVTVKDGEQPITGLLVTLVSKDSHGAYACNGVTNGKGVAEIRSSRGSYTGKGVPSGTYTVVLLETIELPPELVPQESDQDLPQSARVAKDRKAEEFMQSAMRSVPAVLTATGTSPIDVSVTKKQGGTVVVNVAEHR